MPVRTHLFILRLAGIRDSVRSAMDVRVVDMRAPEPPKPTGEFAN
jgi:hypothetical protein